MKIAFYFTLAISSVCLLMSCSKEDSRGDESGGNNRTLPTCNITLPLNNSTKYGDNDLEITVDAQNTSANIKELRLYIDDVHQSNV